MNQGVAITGMGIISAIGNDVASNYRSLLSGTTGVQRVSKIDTIHRDAIWVGEIEHSNAQLEAALKLPKDHNYTRTAMLGLWAAKEAVADAKITSDAMVRTGIISATTVGGMDMTERYFYEYLHSEACRKYIESHHAGDHSQKIATALGINHGLVTTISTACSSAANSVMLGARLIKTGRLDRVIVGGVDPLSKFTINGFNALMILSDAHNTPFDQHRKGLNLGEAAAYLVLESDTLVKQEAKKVYAYVSGYGNANDAFHQTASSDHGDGATLSMQKALEVAGLSPRDIHYINAHGTATRNNDLSEGRALIRVFGDAVPPFSSTKPFTGHTLAAAGGVEAVFSVLALQHNTIFPNLNFESPMEEFKLRPETQATERELTHVLSNSLGFGGNCSTVIYSKATPS
ncbi:beta-ketoacyl-[acyl-carrier-protein] synthase family protein [Altibacter sp. HG106]|uniref:beta-ketoacyl-[acyl-carrier-protein] synthase family protein n=1 Tax=Altibacter sp. HG106 TaxID=3023937 RepID=UPI002350935A|nr:beta-ketoacyl-[acyl-carrier-protein] synthase family protein [Altibacter sp. HG106]MDC7994690.1 beta-ketoacyl-[acyl-carrier-protein] synthase family protein [Altibacter sp. HG106]